MLHVILYAILLNTADGTASPKSWPEESWAQCVSDALEGHNQIDANATKKGYQLHTYCLDMSNGMAKEIKALGGSEVKGGVK